MKDDQVESMDAELRGLLRRGAAPIEAPADAQERVVRRLSRALPLSPFGSSGGGGPAQGNAGPISSRMQAIALGFVMGCGVGAVVMWGMTGQQTRVVFVDRPPLDASAGPIATASAGAEPIAGAAIPPGLRPDAPTPPPARSMTTSTPRTTLHRLNAERLLLDDAIAAFARGDTGLCLAALDSHRSRYPRGAFVEERDALAVRALAAAGKVQEAKDRGRKFIERYPNSLMSPAVQAAIENPSGAPR